LRAVRHFTARLYIIKGSEHIMSSSQAAINGFVDIDTTLTLSWVLQPYTIVNAIQQPVSRDGDFWLCGIEMTSSQVEAPDLIRYNAMAGLRISDAHGYVLFSDFLNSNFFPPNNPFVINPSHLFRAGTHINVDLQEQSGVNNAVQIAFRGRYRYRMSDVMEQAAWVSKVKRYQGAMR
jgi:hypothetical protein